MKPLGLRLKLTLFYGALFALVLSGMGALFYHILAVRLDSSVNDELDERAAGLRGYLRFKEGKPVLAYNEKDPEETYFVHTATRYYQVYDSEGELLEQSRELQLLGIELTPDEVKSLLQGPRFTEVETERVQLRFHNYVMTNNHRTYLVQVGTSLAPMQASLDQFFWSLLLLVPAGVLVAAFAGWWMARKALQPVEVLASTAREISISQLDRRLPLRGTGDELDRLAATFNQVFAGLQCAVEQMKQFTASISHELRTPLTALRGEAEVALLRARSSEDYRQVLTSQLEEFDKLTHMINGLLTLARAEAGDIALAFQPVNLAALARLLAEQMEPVAGAKEVALRVEAEEPVEVAGDAQWLERVILNLLDNAIKFTPAGGRVEVSVRTEDGRARLEVRDTGIGISPEALPHVFERFYRADPSRSKEVDGAGLGLSLVRWIVEEHHGSLQVESQPGRGSCFTVQLPLAASPSASATPRAG